MKKKVLLIFVIALVGIVLALFYYKSNQQEKLNQGLQLPDTIEKQVMENLNQSTGTSEGFLLNDLINSGQWIEIKVPKNYDEWEKIEKRFDEWHVESFRGIRVSVNKPTAIDRYDFGKLDISDGFFLNVYTREYGGAVYFYPDGDKTRRYKIKDGYVWELYKLNNENYALEAFPFNVPRGGKILKLKKSFNKWIAKEITDIGDTPYCYTFDGDNTMYLVTYKKLLKLVNNEVKEVIIDNAFWKSLHPQSIVYDKDVVYIGMRAGVAKVNLTNKEIHFFTPIDRIPK